MTQLQASHGEGINESPELPRRVLVAEDELLLARMLSDLLAGLEIEVVGPAPNGRVAVDLARQERPDLAVLDIRMPEMDGLAVAELLHHELNIPVVMLTAFSDDLFLRRSCELGVCGYLLKPVTMDDLRVGLAMAWRQHRSRLELTRQVSDLERKLRERKVIERAKGLLMKRLGLDEETAMRHLQRQSRDARRPMVDVAQEILNTPD